MQKKILALHDLSGFGRSSLVPIIAVLAAAGHQCVPLPTAVFSTHTAIPGWVTTDLTAAMPGTIDQYDRLGLRFDAIYAGFLGSAEQITYVLDAALRLKKEDGLTLIDPVMGDEGKIYETYTPEMCARMQELCAVADLITPNVTEAAILLGREPTDCPSSEIEAQQWMTQLADRFGAAVLLTGISLQAGMVGVGFCDGETCRVQYNRQIPCYYPGTGDLFDAVLLGYLLNGRAAENACMEAAAFVGDSIAETERQGGNRMHGVQFERLLPRLYPKTE